MSIENRTTASRLIWGGWKIGELLSLSKDGRNASFELLPSSGNNIGLLRVASIIEETGDRSSQSKQEKLEYDNHKILLRQKALNDLTLLMSAFQGNAHILNIFNFTTRDWSDDGKYGCDLLIHTEKYANLRNKLDEGRLFTEYEVFRIGKDICSSLALAHSKGITHKNLKPESIFIGDKGFRLGDFGLESIFENRTTNSMFYAAPESINEGTVNELSDIYSLGLTMYELCGGSVPPFPDSANAKDMNVKLKWNDLPQLKNVSPELSAVITRACSYEPADRFQSVKEFSNALDALNIQKPEDAEDIFAASNAKSRTVSPFSRTAPTATQPIWNSEAVPTTLSQAAIQIPPSQRTKAPMPGKPTPSPRKPATSRPSAPAKTATQHTGNPHPKPASAHTGNPHPKPAAKSVSSSLNTESAATLPPIASNTNDTASTPSWAKPVKAEPGSIRCANSITLDPAIDPSAPSSKKNKKKDESALYIKLMIVIAAVVLFIATLLLATSSCNRKNSDEDSSSKTAATTTAASASTSASEATDKDNADSTETSESETEVTETEAPEPEFTPKTFVENCFKTSLGREPDAASRDEMTAELEGKIAYGSQVAYALIASEEYSNLGKSDSDYINDLYLMMFNRAPADSELSYWLEQMQNGIDRSLVFEVCANSSEFYDFCATYNVESGYFSSAFDAVSLSNVNRFVTKIYLGCLNRLPDQYGQQYWCAALLTKEAKGRDLAASLIFSSEFSDLNLSNTDFMSRMYLTFFDREPDEDGFVYWVDMLDSGTSKEEVFNGFSDAPEFTQLCENYGVMN
ncbi:MAG: DUF4214 domain-containing protein [Clostridia bacterium]|nr:DUF4214 domain-containing protein [Clostridia bacterium]